MIDYVWIANLPRWPWGWEGAPHPKPAHCHPFCYEMIDLVTS